VNTPAHLILALAALGKPGRPRVNAAALAGGLIPDASLYLLAGGALAGGIPAERVFGELYFSDAWQTVFAVDNSVLVWGAVVALGLWARRPWVWVLGAAALLHVALDLPLHHDDGRAHFWPLTGWVYASPYSYWDVRHGAGWIAPLETALVVALAAWCWRRHRRAALRAAIAVLVLAQLAVGGLWAVVFA
jgi:hypothetical protein